MAAFTALLPSQGRIRTQRQETCLGRAKNNSFADVVEYSIEKNLGGIRMDKLARTELLPEE